MVVGRVAMIPPARPPSFSMATVTITATNPAITPLPTIPPKPTMAAASLS